MHLKSELLSGVPGVTHGFGSRDENIPAPLAREWGRKRPVWKQVHGVAIAEVVEPGQSCGEVDALWTRGPGLPLAVVSADCVPVLLARRRGGAVAAVHAGWRGTRARIVRRLLECLAARGESPGDWSAAIGPAIGPCCYEVSEDLAREFAAEFADFSGAVPGHRRLDLPAINAAELRAGGLRDVELIRACTRCSADSSGRPLYHSYRREGGGTRQFSMIGTALDRPVPLD